MGKRLNKDIVATLKTLIFSGEINKAHSEHISQRSISTGPEANIVLKSPLIPAEYDRFVEQIVMLPLVH